MHLGCKRFFPSPDKDTDDEHVQSEDKITKSSVFKGKGK